MRVERTGDGVRLTLTPGETELLSLALQRATFEDTPPDRQVAILEFASALQRQLEGASG